MNRRTMIASLSASAAALGAHPLAALGQIAAGHRRVTGRVKSLRLTRRHGSFSPALRLGCAARLVQEFGERFKKRFNYACDHNGIKGYTAVYFVKAVTEKIGKFDSKAFAEAARGITISPKQEPGILMDVTFDANGDIDRQSFLVEVVEGKQVVKQVLPKVK